MKQELFVDRDQEKRLIAMGQMAASLAHEIRNPLCSMELFCSLLKKDLESQPQLMSLAEQIHTSILTVNHIISNCLQFAKEIIVHKHEVADIRAYLQSAIANLEAKAQESQVKIEVETIGEGTVAIDEYQMKQVIINLASNAIDAVVERFSSSPVNDELRKVRVISDLSDPSVWSLLVVDNGLGISEENKQNIFEPFFSTKKQGTGLGLAVVHSIVKAHQGTIGIESNDVPGCTVTVKVPR